MQEEQLDLILTTGLVSKKYLSECVARMKDKSPVTESDVLGLLVEEGVLSTWQASQIRSGRKKGYIVRQYRIQKLSRISSDTYIAEALDRADDSFVLLKVVKDSQTNLPKITVLGNEGTTSYEAVSIDARVDRMAVANAKCD
jgi:hypothetical protein